MLFDCTEASSDGGERQSSHAGYLIVAEIVEVGTYNLLVGGFQHVNQLQQQGVAVVIMISVVGYVIFWQLGLVVGLAFYVNHGVRGDAIYPRPFAAMFCKALEIAPQGTKHLLHSIFHFPSSTKAIVGTDMPYHVALA